MYPSADEPAIRRASRRGRTVATAAILATLGVLLSGCSLLGQSSTSQSGTVTASPGPTWFFYLKGSPTPSATPAAAAATPSPSASLPWLRLSAPPVVSHPACFGLADGLMLTPTVTAGSGSATVTWPGVNEPTLTAYRVAAVSQDLIAGTQPQPNWTTVTPGAACAPMTATLPGLRSGGWYVIWVDAVTKPVRGPGAEVMIGRSAAFQAR